MEHHPPPLDLLATCHSNQFTVATPTFTAPHSPSIPQHRAIHPPPLLLGINHQYGPPHYRWPPKQDNIIITEKMRKEELGRDGGLSRTTGLHQSWERNRPRLIHEDKQDAEQGKEEQQTSPDEDPNMTKVKHKGVASSTDPPLEDITLEEQRASYKEKLAGGSPMGQGEEQWEEEDEAEYEDGDIVVFKQEADFHKTLFGSPWMIFNHVLSVQPWSPNFRAAKGTIDKAMVWVQFPDIPPNWYHSRLLKILGDLVGQTMKVDIHTSTSSRGKFAKVAVAVDLTKPLKGRVRLDGEIIKVIYEGFPNMCYSCGRVSHNSMTCPFTRVEEKDSSNGKKAVTEASPTTVPGAVHAPLAQVLEEEKE
ncbi:hypothetical protein Tsubulata_010383 [Turnera subulata]|uniref:DUF4283 domain-containing protein n=1 Tax=Turnera subulata TaxID=218843 RepID=A0A9Q0JH35_9ROSI|nr:hypothetical protein Tsubulata_010383 [Turnera subulata]